jgi:predicted RNA binding protein YcfA (HicA-like mRNA interferase family)
MKAAALLRILERELGYVVDRTGGSHRIMVATGRPRLVFAYHKGQTVPPGVVRKILVKDVGLGESEALALVTRRRRT